YAAVQRTGLGRKIRLGVPTGDPNRRNGQHDQEMWWNHRRTGIAGWVDGSIRTGEWVLRRRLLQLLPDNGLSAGFVLHNLPRRTTPVLSHSTRDCVRPATGAVSTHRI